MELPRRIAYNPKWEVIFSCAVFFGSGAAFMAYKATSSTAGLNFYGVITLGPAGATAFYWVNSALCAGFVLLAMLLTVRRIASPQVLELGTDALYLPYGYFQRKTSRIAYTDIERVSEVRVSGQTFLYVTATGLRYTITATLFPDPETYTEVRDFLISHAPD